MNSITWLSHSSRRFFKGYHDLKAKSNRAHAAQVDG